MKPVLALRVASVLTLLHCIGHTMGAVFSPPPTDPQELAIVQAMHSHPMPVMGFMRTYWDFFYGYGLSLSILLLVLAVVMWQLAGIARTQPRIVRPMAATLCVCFAAFAIIDWMYFFWAPLIGAVLIACSMAIAFVTAAPRTATAT